MTESTLEALSDAYEKAESAFLSAVRAGLDRGATASAAREVASAAVAFNTEAYRKLFAKEGDAWAPLDQLTERTEVLSELWSDVASAYEGLGPPL